MEKLMLRMCAVLLLCSGVSAYAQTNRYPVWDCDEMVRIGQRAAQMGGSGTADVPGIIDNLLPSSPRVSDEMFVMLTVSGVTLANAGAAELNWSSFKQNCHNGREGMVSAVNSICSSLGEVVELGAQARDSGDISESRAVSLTLEGMMSGLGGAQSDMGRMTGPLLERIIRREMHTVYSGTGKSGSELRQNVEQRCMFR